MLLSTASLIRLFVLALYVPVCLVAYWRLIPRLSPVARRLAGGMLAAQIIIILLAAQSQPATRFDKWLWDFHEEWNIPATFASVQLAAVGGVALLATVFARTQAALLRWYWAGIGLVFLFLAVDEYLALHEVIPGWEIRYIALGAAVVAATLIVACRSARRAWIWHASLLFGLAMSVAGAILVNALPIPCDGLAFLRFEGCLEFYFLEESLEFLGIWLTLVAVLGQFTDALPTSGTKARRLLYALPALAILAIFVNSMAPQLELRLGAQPASVAFKSGIHLHGYHSQHNAQASTLRLYLSSRQADIVGLGYSIHLVDQASGESLASRDEWADRQHGFWPLGPDYTPLYRQRMQVTIPPDAPRNRALWVVLTLWRKQGGEFTRQAVISSDLQLLDDRQVVLSELVLAGDAPSGSPSPLAVFEAGVTLDAVDLPDRAQAAETLQLRFAWRSEADNLEDLAQFLHFVHQDSGEWWGYDQQPLGPRLPTRLWYSGLADSETWRVPLPADLAPGRYEVFTGLYRAADQQRVAVVDADGAPWLDNRVALGILII